MNPLISVKELLEIKDKHDLVIVDARSGKDANEKYAAEHIAGAYFVDLDKQLSAVKSNAAEGGRHPLPGVEKFASVLGELGILPTDHVVVYDDKSGANAASRFWWMMKAVGHTKIQVLNGGLQAAINGGYPMSNKPSPQKRATTYPADQWLLPTVNMDEVDGVKNNPDYFIIDVRETPRYDGITEPIDLVAGHIPGAHNIPYTSNLDTEGKFLPTHVLQEKYRDAIGDRSPANVIVHCGSGVTACHTLLAMEAAGMQIPNLYVGSWSEWSRNDKPIATGNTPV